MIFNKEMLRLYLIADGCQPDLLKKTDEALAGGVTLVQLRMKEASGREFYEMAREMKRLCDQYQIPFVVNDRIDIALAVDAAGIHVGQSDIPVVVARQLLGSDKMVGITAKTKEELSDGAQAGADYGGAGALAFTGTKPDCLVMTLANFRELCQFSPIPVVGIGGITVETAPMILDSGAAGVSVSSAIMGAIDPNEAARKFLGTEN